MVEMELALERLDLLEAQQRELAAALLDYIRSDMATPWMDSAKRLQSVLVRLMRELE
jgi:hypothetical protein